MRIWGPWLTRPAAACLVLSLFVPFACARSPQQDVSPNPQAANPQAGGSSSAEAQSQNSPSDPKANSQPTQPATLPDSPGSMRSKTVEDNPSSSPQQPSAKEPAKQEPVGTAAAESVETTGVAASKPAGAAIAPAKQRRTRSMLIKVGAIVGASVAVGTVVALSSASPSRPPGAR
jgi:hypothetical protein